MRFVRFFGTCAFIAHMTTAVALHLCDREELLAEPYTHTDTLWRVALVRNREALHPVAMCVLCIPRSPRVFRFRRDRSVLNEMANRLTPITDFWCGMIHVCAISMPLLDSRLIKANAFYSNRLMSDLLYLMYFEYATTIIMYSSILVKINFTRCSKLGWDIKIAMKSFLLS